MGSKKHYSPRYHKIRDLSRLAASPTGSSRKHFRELKTRKHSASRARCRADLVAVTKSRCLCDDDTASTCPRCDRVSAPMRMNRRVGHGAHDNVKYVRWGADKLNPGLRWARVIRARHGEYRLASRLRDLHGVAGEHLKFHIFHREPSIAYPVCSASKLERTFLRNGLHLSNDAEDLLHEIARLACINNAERQLTVWTWTFAGKTCYSDGCLWLPIHWRWWNVHQPRGSSSLHLPLRKDSPVGFPINSNWQLTPEPLRLQECMSGARRPLHSPDDIDSWAHDMFAFFNTFYAENYFMTGYGRWMLWYTISYITEKGNK